MKQLKKTASLLLVICMIITAIPVNVFATEMEKKQIEVEPTVVKVPKGLRFQDGVSAYNLDENGNPLIKNSNEEKWIDRFSDLPDWANEFYDWMVENSDGDEIEDALINPKTGQLYEMEDGDVYVYHMATLPEQTVQFEFPAGGTEEEALTAATDALMNAMEKSFYNDFSYMIHVFGAFDRDYSEVFWLSGDTAYSYNLAEDAEIVLIDYERGFGTLLFVQNYYFILLQPGEFDVREANYRDYEIVYDTIDKRETLTEEILADAAGTREEKLLYFNNYLTLNNGYNTSEDLNTISNNCYECISALEGNAGEDGPICEAYSRAFKLLCDRSNIPCVLVNGYSGEASHMWNYVQMDDGKWYAVDVTFNDPYVEGSEEKESGAENLSYFLVGETTDIGGETFGGSHEVTNQVVQGGTELVNGPVLEENAYVLHEHEYTSAVTEPTCTEQGYATYTCTECGDTYTDDYVEPTGHAYSEPLFSWEEDYSACTATFVCQNECGQDYIGDCEVSWTSEDATCTVPGTIVYTAAIELDGVVYSENQSEMRELGHNYESEYTWTDDKTSCIAIFTCKECGDTSSVNCDVKAEESEGYIEYKATCEFNGVEYENTIREEVAQPFNPFVDVPGDEWYTPYVLWAYERGVTSGYKEDDGTYTFKPQNFCTRAEFVTFLWNLVGTEHSENVENPFSDINEDDWYYDFVLWAYENGITAGYEDGTFRPNKTCTRAEVATFIYNIKGGQLVSEDTENPFEDIDEDDWYYNFVLWGYENEIYSGYAQEDGTYLFMPEKDITRAEVVTMLHGAYTKNPVTGVAVDKKEMELIIGDSAQLEYILAPYDADIKNVTWSSSDETVAVVSEEGLITGLAKGTAVITVKTRDGGYTASCTVTVKEPALVPTVSIGIRTYTTESSSSSEIYVKAEATGGSGTYVQYHIDLYLDDELIAQSDSDDLSVKPIQNGTYEAVVTVIDSSGTEATGTSKTMISV